MVKFTTLLIGLSLLALPALADNPEFTITIKDHKFEPAVLEIPADTKVKLIIDNKDATPEEFESHDLNREKIIKGNSQGIVFVGPLKSGEYKYFGEFNESSAQGVIKVK